MNKYIKVTAVVRELLPDEKIEKGDLHNYNSDNKLIPVSQKQTFGKTPNDFPRVHQYYRVVMGVF